MRRTGGRGVLQLCVVSWGFLTGLGALGIGAVVLAVVLLRRRKRLLGLSFAVPLAMVLLAAGVADGVNAWFSYLPTVRDVASAVPGAPPAWDSAAKPVVFGMRQPSQRLEARGGVVNLPVPDRGSGFGASDALAYLPPQYFSDPTARFPVLYLSHGSPGTPSDWFRAGRGDDIARQQAQEGRPVIVVSPRMSRGWLDDSECLDSVEEPSESHFITDVAPTIDATLRTVPDRDARFIGGMSAGGFCALNIGLRHREEFSAIIDMSGLVEPTHKGGQKAMFGTGPDAAGRARENTPRDYAPQLPAGPHTDIWMDTGTSDAEVLVPMRNLASQLSVRQDMTVHYQERPGAHTFTVWRPALRESLAWVLDALPTSVQ